MTFFVNNERIKKDLNSNVREGDGRATESRRHLVVIAVAIEIETEVRIATETEVRIETTEVLIETERIARKRRRRKMASVVPLEETVTDSNVRKEKSVTMPVSAQKEKNVTKEVNAEYDENENQENELTEKIVAKEPKKLRERSATMAKNVSEGDPLDVQAK